MKGPAISAALALAACAPTTHHLAPSAPVRIETMATVSEPAPPAGPRLDLNLLRASNDGDTIVAWATGVPEGGGRLVCDVRWSSRSARCFDEPADTTVLALSPQGGHVALATPADLIVRETLSDKRVTVRTLANPIRRAAFSPDDVWMAALGSDGVLTLAHLPSGSHITAPVSVTSPATELLTKRRTHLTWLANDTLLVEDHGAPRRLTVSRTTVAGVGVVSEVLTSATATTWPCSASVRFESALLVAACDGYVGMFNIASAQETQIIRGPTSGFHPDFVHVERAGPRALVHHTSWNGPSRLAVVEPASATPLLFDDDTPNAVNSALAEDGRLGWVEERADANDLYRSFFKDVTSDDPAAELPGIIHAWSGPNRVATVDDRVSLITKSRTTFAHYLSWAPWATVIREGRFVWASGANGFIRIADGDDEPLLFDVFGTVEAPSVVVIPPAPVPPPDPHPDEAPPAAVELKTSAPGGSSGP